MSSFGRRPVIAFFGCIIAITGCSDEALLGSGQPDASTHDTQPDAGTQDTGGVDQFEGGTDETGPCQVLAGGYLLQWPGASPFDAPEGWLATVDVSMFLRASCAAVLTPAFRPSVELKAVLSSDALSFEGAPLLEVGNYPDSFSGEEYVFNSIRLPRILSGALTGAADATWDCYAVAMDTGAECEAPATGTVVAASDPPVFQVGPATVYPMGTAPAPGSMHLRGGLRRIGYPVAMMPWEPLQVAASEPVPGLAAAITGTEQFTDAVITPELVAKDVWAWTFFDDWDAVRGTSQHVTIPSGLRSLGGIPTPGLSADVEVLDVGPALSSHEFDEPAPIVGVFGDVTQSDGRIVINEGGGIAGRLVTSGKTRVVVEAMMSADMFFASLRILVTGHQGRDYPMPAATSAEGLTKYTIEIEDEPEVGFTIVPVSFGAHSNATVERVWAE